jgi:hypothetical protein
MRFIINAVYLLAFFAVWATAQSRSAAPTAVSSGWQLTKQVDEFTDKQELTLVLPSNDGLASLRIHCDPDIPGYRVS